jgi:toxin ParE1/3/4
MAARDDFKAAISYITDRNASAARRVAMAIEKTGNDLGDHAIGRPSRINKIYEKSVVGLPYIIAYAIESLPEGGEQVVILRVIHTARNWTKDKWPE